MITALAERFAGGELVFDVMSTLALKMHKNHRVLKESGAQVAWGVDDPLALESWGLHLLDRWGYFDQPEKRLGAAYLLHFISALAGANGVLHYYLGRQEKENDRT